MSRTYDNWERLVAATLKIEQFRQLALAWSRETNFSSTQSDFTFDSPLYSDPDSSRVLSNPSYLNRSINGSHVAEADGPLSPDIKHIALKELKTATKNLRFELRLGSGCGHIHKRWIDEHTLAAAKPGNVRSAAVKKWNPTIKQNRLELMVSLQKEIHYLSQFNHPNLVKLIGYCFVDDCLLLVHEFMQKGSLYI